MGNIRPAGRIRPARPFYAARRRLQKYKLLSQIKPETLYFVIGHLRTSIPFLLFTASYLAYLGSHLGGEGGFVPCHVCQTLLMVSVAYDHGRIQGGRMRGICILPSVIFKNVFDVYNFSVISNLFDHEYALGRHNETCANKMHHIWRSTQNWGQKI